ncbi:putative MRG domain containing protein [Blattamonas nauphoetae]|uniref:MRG domain containing protein n=1 Tax=Blattamonas nauphoetae TaxID=2049346 RepID=A0ABQ9Y2X6_9EUKA|nr:putative MRG domain containing protein [Blattamonas nauphoetae]
MSSHYTQNQAVYALSKEVWYKAKVLKVLETSSGTEYRIHYAGFRASDDETVPPSSLMEINAENEVIYTESRKRATSRKSEQSKPEDTPKIERKSKVNIIKNDEQENSEIDTPPPANQKASRSVRNLESNAISFIFPKNLQTQLQVDLKTMADDNSVHTLPATVTVSDILEAYNEETSRKKEFFINDIFTYFNGLVDRILLTPDEAICYKIWFDYIHLRSLGEPVGFSEEQPKSRKEKRKRIEDSPEDFEPKGPHFDPKINVDGNIIDPHLPIQILKDITSPADIFGGVHLLRLIEKLPSVLRTIKTGKDAIDFAGLEKELTLFLDFLDQNKESVLDPLYTKISAMNVDSKKGRRAMKTILQLNTSQYDPSIPLFPPKS